MSKLSFQFNSSHGASNARLGHVAEHGTAGAWSPSSVDLGQWIQVDLGNFAIVSKIATQGRQDAAQWVTQYKVSYSTYGRHFMFYRQPSNYSVDKVSCRRKLKERWLSLEFLVPYYWA